MMMGIEDGELKEDDCTLTIVNGSHDEERFSSFMPI